ncbi:MAG TPA: RNA methyltransferase, partial [Thermoanaerobaculia bacterium]
GELAGPRGLTDEVLAESEDARESPIEGDDAFWMSLLTPRRLARIESVLEARLESVTVVLDRLLDPHNLAAILRTSEGLGLCEAHVVPNADGDKGAHRRVTQDADKWLEVVPHVSGAEAARALAARGFSVWAGHLDPAARSYASLPADGPVALLFGHEHEGPSPETLAACAGAFRIPMAGFTQSFNVSVAAGIALSQICTARRAFLRTAGDLSPDHKARLRSRYLKLAAGLSQRLNR